MRVRSVLRRIRELRHRDDGMSTAEYAVGTVAAVAFAGILLKVVTSSSVQSALTTIITQALKG
ncbi:MAG TPA: DUF4244 domain-containing protein [Mycobacteriales bacterium]|jgi:TRAP-type uncharacterized transport system fused permease subunit|nr:DUF4244 domain-containing protein [Mycobacteriales bacterium]